MKNKLKQLRTNRGMTQRELADKLNLSPSTIGMYEIGKREPDSATLKKISTFFGISVDELLGNKYNQSDKTTTIKEETIPEYFDDPQQARKYIEKHQIFGADGFELDDEEILEFANELLQQMKMVSYKYRK